ncbi:MAG: SPOR domain-containing protein [Gemmatimonadales bacterium]
MRAPRVVAIVALLALGAVRARAQTDPRLVAVVQAAQEGQGDSARAMVSRMLAATPPTDTLYPQILYTQAMVASTAGEMQRELQRITVEFATSDWADDALLRLVQMDYATRNFAGAARNLERLKVDFPASSLMAQAAYWAGRTYFDSNQPQLACRWLADGMAQDKTDVELQNQLSYLYQRCDLRGDSTALASGSGDSTHADSTHRDSTATDTTGTGMARGDTGARRRTGAGATAPSSTAGANPPVPSTTKPAGSTKTVYRVQIAAIASRKAAEAAARKARPLGLTVITLQQNGLYKVRVGEYPTREAAQTAASSLKAKLGGSPFVVSEP